MVQQAWPTRLLLVRHAESVGNLARDLAESNGEALIDIAPGSAKVAFARDTTRSPKLATCVKPIFA